MKIQHFIFKYLYAVFLICLLAGILFVSCKSIHSVPGALTFSDVEKEFKFAKPLSEQSRQLILRKYGTVQNYRDSIISGRKKVYKKDIIVTREATETDSAVIKIFRMSEDELKKAGITVTRDTLVKDHDLIIIVRDSIK